MTVNGCVVISRVASLVSLANGGVRRVTRIITSCDSGPVTTHAWMPSFAVLAKSVSGKVNPPSRESSIETRPPWTPSQRINWRLPTVHTSVPFGSTTVTPGVCVMKKSSWLSPLRVGSSRSVMRMRAVVTGPATVQSSAPSFGVRSMIVWNGSPFRESAIETSPAPAAVHVICCWLPITQTSPPAGAVTVTPELMKKSPSLSSSRAGSSTWLIRMRQVAGGPVTVHGSDPSFGVLANNVS